MHGVQPPILNRNDKRFEQVFELLDASSTPTLSGKFASLFGRRDR